MVDKKQLIINLSFILAVGIVLYTLLDLYSSKNTVSKYRDLSNPLGLEIIDAEILEDSLFITLYNPNNFTVAVTTSLVGIKNSFGSAAAITFGGDVGIVKYIGPEETTIIHVPILYTDPKRVVLQWFKGGGNLTISLHYTSVDSEVSGVILYRIMK